MRQQADDGTLPSEPKATSQQCYRAFFTQCTQPRSVTLSDLAVKREVRLAVLCSLTAVINRVIARQRPQASTITTFICTAGATRLCRL